MSLVQEINILQNAKSKAQNTGKYVCQSLLLSTLQIFVLRALYCYVYYYTTVFQHSGELSYQRLENHTKLVPEVLLQWCNCTGSLHRCRCMCSAQDLVHYAQSVPMVSIYSKIIFDVY